MDKITNIDKFNISEFIVTNLVTILVVYLSALIFGSVKDLVGQPVWLQIGAVTMSYLLFGCRVFFGIFIGILLSGYFVWGWPGSSLNWSQAFAGSIAPLLAIQTMKLFKLSSFYEDKKLIFEHIIFLAILAAVYNTSLKLFVNTTFRNSILYPDLPPREIDIASFVQSYFFGDIVGGVAFIFILALIVSPFMSYFRQKNN
jgi:hypothetical protein